MRKIFVSYVVKVDDDNDEINFESIKEALKNQAYEERLHFDAEWSNLVVFELE